MKQLFDEVSFLASRLTTRRYSTSFSIAVRTLSPQVRKAIYSIYGFVRLADEIVDTFHNFNKQELLNKFEKDYYDAIEQGISLNPLLNSFQITVKKYQIPDELIQSFLKSMHADLTKREYINKNELDDYIYGSADVVGLMCLKIFVNGDEEAFNRMKVPAMKLGSALQKINFLRDLKNDVENLNRRYFPGIDINKLDEKGKKQIIEDIESDFKSSFSGIVQLSPREGFGVYVAYTYFRGLLSKIKRTPANKLISNRIRISDMMKFIILIRCYILFWSRFIFSGKLSFFSK
jgi:15-cis-phytoene synthase